MVLPTNIAARGATRRTVLCLMVLVALCALGAVSRPAAIAATSSDLTASLVAIPPYLGPNDVLTASFNVTNHSSNPLTGFSIGVTGYDGPVTRTGLENAMEGKNLTQEWGDTPSRPPDAPLGPGETRLVQFNLGNPLSAYQFFHTRAASDHAFPIRFTITAGGLSTTIDTQLIYFQETRVDHPLQVAMVIPLDTPTVFDAQDREISPALENAIAPGGRIDRILSALADPRHADVQVALAPTAKLLVSLTMLANGFVRTFASGTQQVAANDPAAIHAAATLANLKSLAARPGVVLLATPYANAPLPGLLANNLGTEADAQVTSGRSVVKAVLGFDPLAGWFLPADGVVDDPTLTELARIGVQDLVLSPSSLQAGTPSVLTPSAQVRVRSRTGTTPALVVDPVLDSRLLDANGVGLSDVQIRQRFLAETATILLESPARTRTAAVLAPPSWDPGAALIGGILDALVPDTGSPWMAGTTPDQAIVTAANAPSASVAATATVPADAPPKEYFDALRTASGRLADFSALATSQPAPEFQDIVDALSTHLLMAEGEEWWGRGSVSDPGRALARSVADRVKGEFDKIQVRDQTITLTSRQAPIPLVLDSGLNYPVQVVIRLESDKLSFTGGQPCPEVNKTPATCLPMLLLPRSQTVPIKASANFSGRFPVPVEVMTATSAVVTSGKLNIRSTAYNVLALGIMAAAALFILVSWTLSIVRRRVRASDRPPVASPERPQPVVESQSP